MSLIDVPQPKADQRGKRKPSSAERSELYLRSGGLCEYCEEPLKGIWEAEHAYPDDFDTPLYASCPTCNRTKSASPLDVWVSKHARDLWIYNERDRCGGLYRVFLTTEFQWMIPPSLRSVIRKAYPETFDQITKMHRMRTTFGTPERSEVIVRRLGHLVDLPTPITIEPTRSELLTLVQELHDLIGDNEEDEESP